MQRTNRQPPASIPALCPHLGIPEDEQTCLSYPSQWNMCHLSSPATPVPLEHQRKVCLTPSHAHCINVQYDRGTPGRRTL